MSTTLIRGTQIQNASIPLEKLASGFRVPTANLADGANFVTIQTLQTYISATAGAPLITTAVALSGHLAVILDAAGQAVVASPFNPLHGAAVVGVTAAAAASGTAVAIVNQGSLEHLGWTFTPGMPVFLGAMGALVQAIPVGAVFVKVLGMAQSATRVTISLQQAIFIN